MGVQTCWARMARLLKRNELELCPEPDSHLTEAELPGQIHVNCEFCSPKVALLAEYIAMYAESVCMIVPNGPENFYEKLAAAAAMAGQTPEEQLYFSNV